MPSQLALLADTHADNTFTAHRRCLQEDNKNQIIISVPVIRQYLF